MHFFSFFVFLVRLHIAKANTNTKKGQFLIYGKSEKPTEGDRFPTSNNFVYTKTSFVMQEGKADSILCFTSIFILSFPTSFKG